jgi:L-alanine-DL-glutamate epimerase-like enolase superfamily enzyme
MKITDVKAYAVREKIAHPFIWRKGLPGSGDYSERTIVRILTDEGLEGVATIPRGTIAIDLLQRRLKPMLLGKDPVMKEHVWELMWELDRIEEFPIYIMGAIDIALWDLTAKIANMPVYKILGGNSHKVPAYASTVTYKTTEQFLRIADQCLERGYKAIKLHAWGDIKEDAKLCKALASMWAMISP